MSDTKTTLQLLQDANESLKQAHSQFIEENRIIGYDSEAYWKDNYFKSTIGNLNYLINRC